jgi:protein-S-isoprenylcysteine O-methyltransferase Ste14
MEVAELPRTSQWAAFSKWLVHKRVAITLLAFTGLLVEDVLGGKKPLDVTNLRHPVTLLAVIMIIAGLTLRSWAAGTLIKSKALTTSGPYRIVRNPLYAGSYLMMIGFCALVFDVENCIMVAVVIPVLYYATIRKEERFLAGRFGDAWTRFSEGTPRMIPRSVSFDFVNWRLAQWMQSREYRLVLFTLVAFVALKVWWMH